MTLHTIPCRRVTSVACLQHSTCLLGDLGQLKKSDPRAFLLVGSTTEAYETIINKGVGASALARFGRRKAVLDHVWVGASDYTTQSPVKLHHRRPWTPHRSLGSCPPASRGGRIMEICHIMTSRKLPPHAELQGNHSACEAREIRARVPPQPRAASIMVKSRRCTRAGATPILGTLNVSFASGAQRVRA